MKLKKILLLITVLLLLPVKINAYNLGESAVLMEQDTKRVLVSKNMNKKKLIASTTKIMTGIIAVESGKLNKTVTVTDKVLESYGSNIYLSIGEKMKLKDMVYGLMMQSGNDAALMIADYLGGEEKFVKMMNKKAKQIGMKNTTFSNPHGLDEKTYVWTNKNKLLYTYKYTTGGKTGYTDKARRTLVTSASNGNLDLIVVTLNDPNDFKNHKELYEYAFENYSMEKIFDRNKINLPNKKIYAKDDYYYPITKEEKDLININYKIKDKKKYKDGEMIGYAIINLGAKTVHKEKLYIKVKK